MIATLAIKRLFTKTYDGPGGKSLCHINSKGIKREEVLKVEYWLCESVSIVPVEGKHSTDCVVC